MTETELLRCMIWVVMTPAILHYHYPPPLTALTSLQATTPTSDSSLNSLEDEPGSDIFTTACPVTLPPTGLDIDSSVSSHGQLPRR